MNTVTSGPRAGQSQWTRPAVPPILSAVLILDGCASAAVEAPTVANTWRPPEDAEASNWPDIHNGVAEWNIGVDPVAADEVFSARLEIHLVSLGATHQVLWFESDAERQYPYPRAAHGRDLDKQGRATEFGR